MKNSIIETFNSHSNGDEVRRYYKEGSIVEFMPKGWAGGKPLIGFVEGHIYTCVLRISCNGTIWWASTYRARKISDSKEDIKN